MSRFIARQGDVILVETTKRPVKGTRAGRKNGRLVLAEGEVTGHAHAISAADVDLYIGEMEEALLVVGNAGAIVTHEEHGPIALDPGTYEVVHQREYRPQAIRRVAD